MKESKTEDVDLTSQELMAASTVLIEFLKDWEHGLYASMVKKVHLPVLTHKLKVQVLQKQFEKNPLLSFEEDVNITKASGDWHKKLGSDKRIRIGYVDFGVVVICGNSEGMVRVGVFVRLVMIDGLWLVNPHSMNRRFDPKLADDVNEESKEDEADG